MAQNLYFFVLKNGLVLKYKKNLMTKNIFDNFIYKQIFKKLYIRNLLLGCYFFVVWFLYQFINKQPC